MRLFQNSLSEVFPNTKRGRTSYNGINKETKDRRKESPQKSIPEVLGSLQLLLPLDFDLQEVFESYLTIEHKGFFSLLRVIEPFVESFPEDNQHRGRPSYSVLPFLRAALAKRYFKIVATSDLRLRLLSDTNLKQICGFENIPSAASFSRYMSYLADNASL